MFRLVAVTLAGIFGVLYVVGDESRRPEDVARAEPLGIRLVTVAALPFEGSQSRVHVSEISDAQAVELAVEAGRAFRSARKSEPQTIRVAAAGTSAAPLAEAEPQRSFWYVTGSVVNLRGGPGTSNPVVGTVTLGTEAEVLSDNDGWFEIRLADGSASGWIFGKFLNQQRPG